MINFLNTLPYLVDNLTGFILQLLRIFLPYILLFTIDNTGPFLYLHGLITQPYTLILLPTMPQNHRILLAEPINSDLLFCRKSTTFINLFHTIDYTVVGFLFDYHMIVVVYHLPTTNDTFLAAFLVYGLGAAC